jgi:hypothetical protein
MTEQAIVGYRDEHGGKPVRPWRAQFTGPLWPFKD